MIFDIFFISCTVSLLLFIWFHTEAFIEYATFVGGNRFFHIDDFRKKQEENDYPAPHIDYVGYLLTYHGGFFVRLISCPICLSVWLTLVTCFFMEGFILFPIANVLSLIIYRGLTKVLEV